jgi:hypothetical protein
MEEVERSRSRAKAAASLIIAERKAAETVAAIEQDAASRTLAWAKSGAAKAPLEAQ